MGRDSSVGIAISYDLESPGIESRWVVRFLAHVQNGLEANPDSHTIVTVYLNRTCIDHGVDLTSHPV